MHLVKKELAWYDKRDIKRILCQLALQKGCRVKPEMKGIDLHEGFDDRN